MSSAAERKRKRKHANAIRAAAPRADPVVVEAKEAVPVRDGMVWLIQKLDKNKRPRLTEAQCQAARYYRGLYRDPGGAAIRSALDFQRMATAGCSHGVTPSDPHGPSIDSRVELAVIRARVLNSHAGMIDVLDDVCGKGRRLTDMAENDREASRMEAVLKVALDLIAVHIGAVRLAA